ncbi:MAG: hypothetical protein Q7J78_06310, partial [Clostridiales bacterium]|nr:hypothetical protein [Clostridiales bacterium]
RIFVHYSGSTLLEGVISRNDKSIMSDVLANFINPGLMNTGYVKEWNVNGEVISIEVNRVASC